MRREWHAVAFTVVAILLAQQSALSFANLCCGFRHPCQFSFLNQRPLAALFLWHRQRCRGPIRLRSKRECARNLRSSCRVPSYALCQAHLSGYPPAGGCPIALSDCDAFVSDHRNTSHHGHDKVGGMSAIGVKRTSSATKQLCRIIKSMCGLFFESI
jgi:hypothetical protein